MKNPRLPRDWQDEDEEINGVTLAKYKSEILDAFEYAFFEYDKAASRGLTRDEKSFNANYNSSDAIMLFIIFILFLCDRIEDGKDNEALKQLSKVTPNIEALLSKITATEFANSIKNALAYLSKREAAKAIKPSRRKR